MQLVRPSVAYLPSYIAALKRSWSPDNARGPAAALDELGAIEKAIRDSDLGLNPATSGDVIRVPMPALTEERRKELVKTVHHRAEEGRVAVRNVRRHSKEELEKLERDSAISEDDLKRAEKELQKLTDQSVAEIDEIQRHKEQELMEV